MSASVASKNLFDLLGNDIEDPDAPPPTAPKEVVKNSTTSKKRDEKPSSAAPVAGAPQARRKGRGGNDAYTDRDAGRDNNLAKNVEEESAAQPSYRGRVRGRGRQHDRHSQTGRVDTDKQVNQAWGAPQGEWNDELAGAELAANDATVVDTTDPNAVPATEDTVAAGGETTEEVPGESEEAVKTYDEYLAELAQRQADLGPPTEVRRPNEGGGDKKWAAAKELSRKEEEGGYFVGESKDKARYRARKAKNFLEIDQTFVEREGRPQPRGGRGGRGGHGGRGFRGFRGSFSARGDRSGNARTPNLNDTDDFPSLGA